MKTNTLMSVIGSLVFFVLTLTSCVLDVPVPMGGGGPIIQQGGPPPGYQGRPIYHENGGDFNPGNGYRGRLPGGGYYGGGNGYNSGPNVGPPIFYGEQRETVYGNGPQSYARIGQPRPTTYQGRNW
jgi:hypothetical protein